MPVACGRQTREPVIEVPGTEAFPINFSVLLGGAIGHRRLWTGRRRELAQPWPSASPNMGGLGPPTPTVLMGLCGIAFCLGTGTGLYLKSWHFWTTEAIAVTEDRPQVVNRAHKDDRLPAMITGSVASFCRPQDGFAMLDDPVDATITIRDANGWLELDPLRRTTVVIKREARRVPSSKEPGRHIKRQPAAVQLRSSNPFSLPAFRAKTGVRPLRVLLGDADDLAGGQRLGRAVDDSGIRRKA
jgi:hypothetical protein